MKTIGMSPAELRRELDRIRMSMLDLELERLAEKFAHVDKPPTLMDTWRAEYARAGHSQVWIETVIDAEVHALEEFLKQQQPMRAQADPAWPRRAALAELSRPANARFEWWPQVG